MAESEPVEERPAGSFCGWWKTLGNSDDNSSFSL